MTETRFSLKSILLGGIAGLIVGVIVGGIIGFVVAPIRGTNVDISDLKPDAQDNFIVLVADGYAYDKDVPLAQQRLAQLNDQNLKTRISKLANTYATKDNQIAGRLAALDLALGSNDSGLRTLAQNVTNSSAPTNVPTKFAQAPATPTTVPTDTPTSIPAPTNTATPTNAPKPTSAPKPVAAAVQPTAAPAAASIPAPLWLPPLQSDWPTSIFFRPANVTPGQKYWHLVKALYCDRADPSNNQMDTRNNCPDFPGGATGVDTYVMLLNPDGSRAESDLNVRFDNGNGDKVGNDIVSPKDASDMCNCNYTWETSNYLVQVAGLSDAVGGMCLCSRIYGFGSRSHVRYFFWFQVTTR